MPEESAKSKKSKKRTVIGIVAEYDPFHNGHALHLAEARKIVGEVAPVVVALSSSFTQRGFPSFACKMARAKMALSNGANLVLELPFVHACNSGQEFALGAVGILAATRFVTHLAFGAEDASAFSLKKTKDLISILIQEPVSFKLNLKKNLAAGCSYPKALALALELEVPGSWGLVSSPNNALAISYLTEIQRNGYPLVPIPVQREGSAHKDEGPKFSGIASASAIRKALSSKSAVGLKSESAADWVKGVVPVSVWDILEEERGKGRLYLNDEKLWDLFRGFLIRSAPQDLEACAGMGEGLGNLFLKHYASANSYEDFLGRCVCARYTRNRLRRQTVRCLTGVSSELPRAVPPYIRVLGYDIVGRGLLRERKKLDEEVKKFDYEAEEFDYEPVPVITRLPAANKVSGAARKIAEMEFRASSLRELLLLRPDLTREEKLVPLFRAPGCYSQRP